MIFKGNNRKIVQCHSLPNTGNIVKVALTGFPVSSSNTKKDLPMLINRDFLQMTPLSKQSTFSAATLNITSALLCGGDNFFLKIFFEFFVPLLTGQLKDWTGNRGERERERQRE